MEEQLNSLAITHLLQHTLRSLCIHDNSQWVYAVFWRILPRNYPPPKWDSQGGVYDRSRGNRRNWILVWEDGFCNFAASTSEINGGECPGSSSSVYGSSCDYQHYQGLQPELFFKMSHEIYNYGEGLIGKVAADHSHKWIHKEPSDQEINFLSAWHNSADSYPRTWEAQFQSGIKTIALIAVREGVIQLGAVHKVIEDLSYVVLLRKKFSYIESIPGVLLPHPSSSAYPFKIDAYGAPPEAWHFQHNLLPPNEYYDHFAHQPMKITPSMSSLEALLSKLPSVVPVSSAAAHFEAQNQYLTSATRPMDLMGAEKVAKEEYEEEDRQENDAGETSGSVAPLPYHHHHHHHHFAYHHDLNVSSSMNNNGC
ncbi:protein RICE SALT SENSITIVE 3 [Sesamum alatum]|uniref:Protein RICE SALT SENSITIVE 3 n=1 Tax=Sesamum alatum TaxID=300844 RepID=A0AAE2CPL1_9LAMI|nr:protein RICE SALT SENSITIVE 3 [Sesamum alatum]